MLQDHLGELQAAYANALDHARVGIKKMIDGSLYACMPRHSLDQVSKFVDMFGAGASLPAWAGRLRGLFVFSNFKDITRQLLPVMVSPSKLMLLMVQ